MPQSPARSLATGQTALYTFDPATGEMLSLTDPNNNTTTFTYDSNMLLLTTTDPLGHVTRNTTTAASDQTGTTDQLGIGTSSVYNSLHEPFSVTDTQGQTTNMAYNAAGDPMQVTDPLGYTTLSSYNSNGTVQSRTDGNNHTTRFGYDGYGDAMSATDALNRTSTMSYDTNISRLSSVTDPKHQTTRFGYDGEDRTTTVTYQDGSVTRNTYDADGNVTQTTDKTGTTSTVYDGDNRPIRQTSPDNTVVTYSYDAAGRLQSKTDGLGTTTYSYDPAGRLTSVSNSLFGSMGGSGQFSYFYDKANRLTALASPNKVQMAYTLDNDNRVTGLTQLSFNGGYPTPSTLFSDTFSYQKPDGTIGSQRTGETRNDEGITSTLRYIYDADARLTGATAAVLALTSGGPPPISPPPSFFVDGNPYLQGGSSCCMTPQTIDTSGVSSPAPQYVYQSERAGPMFSYAIPNLTPNAPYTVRLHFAEIDHNAPGQRQFNVAINATQVLTNFDIAAAAGAPNRAVIKEIPVTADRSGNIAIQFTSVRGFAQSSGVEIVAGTFAPAPPAVAAVNFGGPAAGSFAADPGGSNSGNWYSTQRPIDTSNVPLAAPQGVYQTERTGFFTYDVPNLTPGASYSIRLHFADTTDSGPGQSQFNLAINATQVLTNVDVYAAAGGGYKASVKQLKATADANGHLFFAFQPSLGIGAQCSGIEIFGASNTGVNGGGTTSGIFAADSNYVGGATYSTSQPINTGGVPNPAPQNVYQTARIGPNFSYALPNLTPNAPYTVRLHFAEIGAGDGQFNVSINGSPALTNFSIGQTVHVPNGAVIEQVTAQADGNGRMAIQFTSVVGPAQVNGIELIPLNPSPTSYAYGYDAVGNMTSNNGMAQSYDADNQILSAGSTTFSYDNNGNQTGTSESTSPVWSYDAQNHTVGYNDLLSSDTFLTNAGMQRRQKSVTTGGSTTTGTYDDDMTGLASYHQTAPQPRTIYYMRDPSGRLLALTDGSIVYYYGLDGHGSVANLTDANGNVVNTYRYDPYGNSLGKTETAGLPNPWQYAGGYYDAESGLYLLGARYYAPTLGRFLQQDPLGSATDSQYAYAGSDPCNNSDPTGLRTCYHHVTHSEIKDAIATLQQDIATNNALAGLGGGAGVASGGVRRSWRYRGRTDCRCGTT